MKDKRFSLPVYGSSMKCTIIGQKIALQFRILYFISDNNNLEGTGRRRETACLEGICIYPVALQPYRVLADRAAAAGQRS